MTRQRLIDAAIDTIVVEGYYRASSNRIAARADVSWGTIQYHFGGREELLLAASQALSDELVEVLRTFSIQGEGVADRLESMADMVWSFYGRSAYLATAEIMVNLGKDPQTKQTTIDSLVDLRARSGPILGERADELRLPVQNARAAGIRVFHMLRHIAIAETLVSAYPARKTTSSDPRSRNREILLAVLTEHFDGHRDSLSPFDRPLTEKLGSQSQLDPFPET